MPRDRFADVLWLSISFVVTSFVVMDLGSRGLLFPPFTWWEISTVLAMDVAAIEGIKYLWRRSGSQIERTAP